MLGYLLSDATNNRWLQRAHRWARKAHGWNSMSIVRRRMHKVRPPISAAFDTVVAQLCKVERGAWYSVGKSQWENSGIDQGFYGPAEAPYTGQQRAEIPYINAVCELVRRGQMELYRIPTIEEEKQRRPDRHSNHMGCANIDHGVNYLDLGFECPRMKFTVSKFRGFPFPAEKEDCSINIGRHGQMLEQFHGKKQFRDAWHLLLCDSFGIEIFFTCDEKFLKRHQQINEKLKAWGLRTRVMRPSEFCKDLGIAEIPIAPTDPYGLFRGTIR